MKEYWSVTFIPVSGQPPGGQISFLIIPIIICTYNTVIKSFLKSIIIFYIFLGVSINDRCSGALAPKLRAVGPRFFRIKSMRL